MHVRPLDLFDHNGLTIENTFFAASLKRAGNTPQSIGHNSNFETVVDL